MRALLPVCVLASVVACDDAVGPWGVEVLAEESVTLESDAFDREAVATATFRLPETYEGDIPDAYYRFSARFVRQGSPGDAVERVLLRATPLYPTSEGTQESTSILFEGQETNLAIYGALERCAGPLACSRELRARVGWLTPPPAGAQMSLEASFAIELRGGNAEAPPPDASAEASFTFEP